MTAAFDDRRFLATGRGKLTLALLCVVAFLDFADASIVTVALPSIRDHLHFSVQNLQWVASGYFLTYGGFMLLGGRAGDLLGRRRVLVAGTSVFALSSLACGLAGSEGMLIAARLAQGCGAAMMSPAALSTLTTTFADGVERNRALGAWGAMAGLGAVVGVLLGGLLTAGPGWRWVFFITLPVCLLVLAGCYRLLPDERRRAPAAHFDTSGALLVTGGMLLLDYALVKAAGVGWGNPRTLAELAVAIALLAAFVVVERRHRNPLVPLSIFRIKGLAAADATQVIAQAGFFSMFFFLTLYMQNVLGYSPIQAGLSFAVIAVGVAISAAVSSLLFARTGTRPLIVTGSLLGSAALYWLSKLPVHGTYMHNLLVPFVIFAFALGAVFVGVQTAANAGVPPDKAGLAAALITASTQVGGALGLAIFTAIATSRTRHLLTAHVSRPVALTAGFHRALLAASIFLFAAAITALRATNTRGEPAHHQAAIPVPETT